MLTVAEILTLKQGEEIVVTWSGGNGPHTYKVVWLWPDDPEDVPCVDNIYNDPLIHSRSDVRCLHKVARAR